MRELENLKLSLSLLTLYHNRAFRYPIIVAHDEPLDASTRAELASIAGQGISFVRLDLRLPSHIKPEAVPEKVLGFAVAYRHMIRWKVCGACLALALSLSRSPQPHPHPHHQLSPSPSPSPSPSTLTLTLAP